MFKKTKIFFFNYFLKVLNFLPPKYSCSLSNFRQIIMNRKVRFFYLKDLNLYKVKSDNLSMYFFDKMRGFNTYAYGIKERAVSLAATYNLNLIKFSENDVVIDCGANYGDLYTWTLINNCKINYISFEPSPKDFKCVELNCSGQKNNNIALSNKTGKTEFYLKTDSGDSSLLEPAEGFTEIIEIETTTLKEFVIKNKINHIKFFKLEAEGFEPEILNGSKDVLNRIEYIGVDGSPERGPKAETTIDYAIKFLTENNFKMIGSNIYNQYAKALFKNQNFKNL